MAAEEQVRRWMKELEPLFLRDFRWLHENPELSFREFQTTAYIRKELEEIPGLVLTGSLGNNIEINAQGIDKGIGMIELGHRLGIDRDEIMACGDGDNDLEMLKAVGFGVAMGNAEESVKAVADYVTDTNEEEGVAKAVEKFALR